MLIEALFKQAQTCPHKTAFIHDGVPCSYAEFACRIARTHADLAGLGLPAGSVAVLDVEHLAQSWVLGITLRHLGLVTVNLQGGTPVGGLGLDGISCVVTVGAHDQPVSVQPVAGMAWRRVVVPMQPLGKAQDSAVPTLPAAAHPSGGQVLLTSGTTGQYKKVLRDAQAEYGTVALHAQINQIGPDAVVYVRDFPAWTAGGYRWPLVAWSQGATVIFQQSGDFQRPYHRPDLTHAFATPTTLRFLLNPAAEALPRNDGLRLYVTGGAMTRAMAAAARERLTTQVFSVLASTEALTLGVTPVTDLDELPWHCIHPLREVQVVDDAGQVLATGQPGHLRARVLDGLCGYVGDKATSQRFFRDGWFYSGDLGTFRADGRLALSGRVTDVVNVMGNKLATGPMERALQDQLGAEAVCMLSLPGSDGDDEVHVVIERRRKLTRPELEALSKGPLRAIPHLRFVVLPSLPRNAMGKVLRAKVRVLLEPVPGRR